MDSYRSPVVFGLKKPTIIILSAMVVHLLTPTPPTLKASRPGGERVLRMQRRTGTGHLSPKPGEILTNAGPLCLKNIYPYPHTQTKPWPIGLVSAKVDPTPAQAPPSNVREVHSEDCLPPTIPTGLQFFNETLIVKKRQNSYSLGTKVKLGVASE